MGRRADARRILGHRALLCWGAAAALTTTAASVAASQERPLYARLNLDRLRLESLGLGAGRIMPSQVEPATIYTFSADYGEIARRWRVVFGISYWDSRYRDNVVQAFVDTLNNNLDNPQGGARVVASEISLYDVTFGAEARWTPSATGAFKPYLGAGLAAHVINAEGDLITGTFVERALDNIAAGVFATGGVSLKVLSHFGIEASARADLLSGFRSTQLRAGAAYYFGHVRGTGDPGANDRSNASRQ